jgi:hypothetical protein
LPWTESRSRDEWLADVRRRGERIRRRRRFAVTLVGLLALALPAGVVATSLTGRTERPVELTAAGPTFVSDHPTGPIVDGAAPDGASPTTVLPPISSGAGGGGTAVGSEPSGPVSPTTTAEVHLRIPAVNGVQTPTSPSSVPPTDDPVVHSSPSTTVAASTTSPTQGRSSATSASPPGPPPPVSSSPAEPCAAADVLVTVVTDRAVYAPGETVTGTSTLENRAAAACVLPTRPFFRIEDASGKPVGSFAYTAEFRVPEKVEPGRTFSGTFTWDQSDCSGAACAQVPAGTYVAVADWTESGPYSGRAPFQIGA